MQPTQSKTHKQIVSYYLQLSFNINKLGGVVQLSKCSFFNGFDILSDTGKQLQSGLSQEGVICAFVLLWSLVPSNPSLQHVVHFGVHRRTQGLLYV